MTTLTMELPETVFSALYETVVFILLLEAGQ